MTVDGKAATMLLLIADTHLGPGQGHRLLTTVGEELDHVDVIIHAGDITDPSVLQTLAWRAPDARIIAVKGNNDVHLTLPARVQIEVNGCLVGVVHDSGAATGRRARVRRLFPSCGLVVFGHSHMPWHEVDVALDGRAQHQINPGSPTVRRRAPACTTARVTIRNGEVADVEHVVVGSRRRERVHPASSASPARLLAPDS
jgi:putative phosphoesterase